MEDAPSGQKPEASNADALMRERCSSFKRVALPYTHQPLGSLTGMVVAVVAEACSFAFTSSSMKC